jgi:hypothetical protein
LGQAHCVRRAAALSAKLREIHRCRHCRLNSPDIVGQRSGREPASSEHFLEFFPGRASRFTEGPDTMKKLSIAILSLTALGLSAEMAFAGLFKCCCCDRYTVCCKPYNAFSPPCCTPCGKNWPCCMGGFTPAPCPAPMADCAGCGQGYAPAPGGVPRAMPPATAAPGYMGPAPTEVGEPQAMMPGYGMPMMPNYGMAMPGYGMPGYGMPMMPNYGMPMQPVAFQPGYYPAAMPSYPMPQAMPNYAAPMMAPGMH